MELVSETDNCSAKLARNKTATEEEKKEDKKRKRIGIGETVTVTLTSKKPALLEPKDQIRWKVTQGKGLLEDGLKSENENPDAVTFKINPAINKEQIQQAGKIVIEVEPIRESPCPNRWNLMWSSPNYSLPNMKKWRAWRRGLLHWIWVSPEMEMPNTGHQLSFLFQFTRWTFALKGFTSLKKIKVIRGL